MNHGGTIMLGNLLFFGLLGPGCTPQAATVSFQTIDGNGCPVPGAVYRLICACGHYLNAITGRDGCVSFSGIRRGSYQLMQIASPSGYLLDSATHEVCVKNPSCVLIDSLPMRCFKSVNEKEPPSPAQISDPPAFSDVIRADAVTINGIGNAGCMVEVSFPNGCKCTACTHRDGTWSVDVPCEYALDADDVISAVQTCPCKEPSEVVTTVVQAV
jgi:hypothetical protein